MLHILPSTKTVALVASLLVLPPISGAFASEKASVNDTARFLAGMLPADTSPLSKLTKDPYWQQHARLLDGSWKELDTRRLAKIRSWTAVNLKDSHGPLFYMFSGPDFLYADAFYPNATTYVLSGLEPVGRIPEINERTRQSLGNLRSSMNSSISLSFFITKDMKSHLSETGLSGTLPILYVYAARAGKTISDVSLVTLDSDGKVSPAEGGAPRKGVPGAKIVFSNGEGGPPQTLYYFSTDVSDSGVRQSGFLKFCDTLGAGDALFKSASYLPHSGSFSQVRDFVIRKSQHIVQDDSGIPISYLKADQWQLTAFGRYLGPIDIFPGRHQQKLADMYQKGLAKPLDFGLGYRWRPNESNVLLAVRKDLSAKQ